MTVKEGFPRRELPATVARAGAARVVEAAAVAARLAAAIPAVHTEHHRLAAADRHEAAIVSALVAHSTALLDIAVRALPAAVAAGLAAQARWHAGRKTSWSSPGHTRQPLHSPGACHRWSNNPVRHLDKISDTMDIVSSIFTFLRRLYHVYSFADQEATNVVRPIKQIPPQRSIRKTNSVASYLKKMPCSTSR